MKRKNISTIKSILETKTYKQLRAYASEIQLSGRSKMHKAELLAALIEIFEQPATRNTIIATTWIGKTATELKDKGERVTGTYNSQGRARIALNAGLFEIQGYQFNSDDRKIIDFVKIIFAGMEYKDFWLTNDEREQRGIKTDFWDKMEEK